MVIGGLASIISRRFFTICGLFLIVSGESSLDCIASPTAAMTGEQNADEMRHGNDGPVFLSNHAGGILGGISTGQDVVDPKGVMVPRS